MKLKNTLRDRKALDLIAALTLAVAVAAESPSRTVEAAAKPGQPWHIFPTRTLADLPGAASKKVDSHFTSFGGQAEHRVEARGFFYATKLDDRWWLVDPEGGLFLNKGVAGVAPLRTAGAQAAFKSKFGGLTNWAAQTTRQLHDLGFNGLGAWSDTATMAAAPQPLNYTHIWNFMASYGSKRGGTFMQPGHTGYPNDCIFVFDPGFETFCDEYAKKLAADKSDPQLFGHFSDNELPFQLGALTNYLALSKSDPGQRAAVAWLQTRHGANAGAKEITVQDHRDFLEFVVARYFRIVGAAIKKYDPNHLYLGSRFYGRGLAEPEILRAAGPFVDVVSVNYYNTWTPDAARLAMWERESHKPVLITEWYAKGVDSGMGNTGGAGWLVKTQRERGEFYENFTLGLLESKVCVGWHWFKYIDNDPADTKTDPSNRDSNKGLFNNRFEPYTPLLESMKKINQRAYSLIEYFDRKAPLTSKLGILDLRPDSFDQEGLPATPFHSGANP